METSDIWIGIIIPIFIGPICAYLMTLRNDYVERKYGSVNENSLKKNVIQYIRLSKAFIGRCIST